MAHGATSTRRARTVGYISYDAQVRIDQRVARILDRRETAVARAQLAARQLAGGTAAEDLSVTADASATWRRS